MAGPVALIVSHGQPSEPQVAEDEVAKLAARVGQHLPDWTVLGATLAGHRTLESALIEHQDQPLVVYPLFMSDGWFTRSVLPKRIDATFGPGATDQVTQLQPLGLDPALVDLAVDAIQSATSIQGIDTGGTVQTVDGIHTGRDGSVDCEVVVAGHGSSKSARPAEITYEFANAMTIRLGHDRLVGPVRCGFVEQEPFLADVLLRAGPQACCLPFFAARRGHVLDDIPAAAEAAGFHGPILDPIGCHPGVPRLIAESLRHGG